MGLKFATMEADLYQVVSNGFLKVMPAMKFRQISPSSVSCRSLRLSTLGFLTLLAFAAGNPHNGWGQEPQAPQAESTPSSEPAEESTLQLSDAEIADLVAKLGSQQFNEREAATRQLQKVGQAALPQLREATQSKDREIRIRAEQLVKAMEEKIRKSVTLKFLRETDPSLDYGMKGWKFASGILGTTRKSRELYLQIYQADPKLVALLDESPDTAPTEVLNFAGRMSTKLMLGEDITVG